MHLVVGIIEKDEHGGTLYCTVIFIDSNAGYVAKHRKLMPTAMERLTWGFGNATTLPIVEFDLHCESGSVVKARSSATICWEVSILVKA